MWIIKENIEINYQAQKIKFKILSHSRAGSQLGSHCKSKSASCERPEKQYLQSGNLLPVTFWQQHLTTLQFLGQLHTGPGGQLTSVLLLAVPPSLFCVNFQHLSFKQKKNILSLIKRKSRATKPAQKLIFSQGFSLSQERLLV